MAKSSYLQESVYKKVLQLSIAKYGPKSIAIPHPILKNKSIAILISVLKVLQ